MIINLFSVFDPTSYFKINLNWVILLLIFIYFPTKYYILEGGILNIYRKLYFSVGKVFKEVSFPNYLALNFLCVVTFIYLVIRNLLGLFPFIFTSTAHPVITLGLGLVLWISFFLIGFTCKFKERCAHLVPEGSPFILSPLIVIIERISHLIRPFTLSIRLAANIIAGHLIIGLLSRIRIIRLFGFFSSLILQNLLFVLEFGVTVIQGFVFRILLLLYALEYY